MSDRHAAESVIGMGWNTHTSKLNASKLLGKDRYGHVSDGRGVEWLFAARQRMLLWNSGDILLNSVNCRDVEPEKSGKVNYPQNPHTIRTPQSLAWLR